LGKDTISAMFNELVCNSQALLTEEIYISSARTADLLLLKINIKELKVGFVRQILSLSIIELPTTL
jgi:hypothetical protein